MVDPERWTLGQGRNQHRNPKEEVGGGAGGAGAG